MKNALLFRLGGLGDLLVALPAMRLLRLAFPSAKLTLCSRKAYGELLLEAGVIDRVIAEESRELWPLFAGEPVAPVRIIMDALNKLSLRGAERLVGEAAPVQPRVIARNEETWQSPFDLIVGWMQGEKPAALERTLAAAGLRAQILFIHAPAAGVEQLSRFFFDKTKGGLAADPTRSGDGPLTGPAAATISFDECANLPMTQETLAKGRALWGGAKPPGRYAVVHPGSGGAAKRWPPGRFMALVERLANTGITGALVTGEAEEEGEAGLSRFPLPPSWLGLRSPDLASLAGLLAQSSLYVGNDSGVTHLAAACGAPTVALFLSDLSSLWKPYGRVHLLKSQRLEDIAVDSVWATVSGLLGL